MQTKYTPTTNWLSHTKSDLPASLVVFAVALPLCVAIAKASGVPTASGIVTAIIGGVVVGAIGGGPLQVSGPTAGLIAVLLGVQEELGPASLGGVVLLAGLIQIVAGTVHLGQWFRAVSPAVILGMLAGIGAILLAQQFHVAVDDAPARSPLVNFLDMPQAVMGVFDGHDGHKSHFPAAIIGLLTLAILVLWKQMAPKAVRSLPAVLVAVVVTTAVATLWNLPVQRVDFESLASGVTIIDLTSIPSMLGSTAVWRAAFAIAVLASAESLLTAAALDGLHTGVRTQYDRELTAQGIGNALCGVVGALPMAGVIVRSSANLSAGAKSRCSTIFHGVWMLCFALLLPGLLRLIPTSALAATLVLTGFRLVQFSAIRALWKESRSEGAICIAVAIAVITVDLLSGVLFGIVLSIVKLAYIFSRLRIHRHDDVQSGKVTLILDGAATFIRLPKLAVMLENIPSKADLHIDIAGLSYIDHTCLALLRNCQKQLEASGRALVIDWDTLHLDCHAMRLRSIRSNGIGGDAVSVGDSYSAERGVA